MENLRLPKMTTLMEEGFTDGSGGGGFLERVDSMKVPLSTTSRERQKWNKGERRKVSNVQDTKIGYQNHGRSIEEKYVI